MTFHSQLKIIRLLLSVVFIQFLSGFSNLNKDNTEISSIDSLFSNLIAIEEKSMGIRKTILDAIGKDPIHYDVEMLIHLYEINNRSYVLMNQILTQTLGNIGDKKVIPILMEIAQNSDLSINIRNSAVEILSKKQAPELVDFLVAMLGDHTSRNTVNEFALNVIEDPSEERMILALLEAYHLGQNKYYSLLNTVMNSLDNFNNPKIKSVYKEIAGTNNFPRTIRLKAFKGLINFSGDPETADVIIELLNDPDNYVYYQEIIDLLKEYGIYDDYQNKLRIAAFKAMKKDADPFEMENE